MKRGVIICLSLAAALVLLVTVFLAYKNNNEVVYQDNNQESGQILSPNYEDKPDENLQVENNIIEKKEKFDVFPARKEDFLSPPNAYGLWPYGVKGADKNSHNEGHPGWDLELKNGAKLYAIGDIKINQIHDGDKQKETGEVLQVIEASAELKEGRVGIVYHSVKNIESYVIEGATIKEGTILAEAGYPISDESVMIHFGIFAPMDSIGTCPSNFFSEKNNEVISFMVSNSKDMKTNKPYASACIGKINKELYYENFPDRIQYIMGGEPFE